MLLLKYVVYLPCGILPVWMYILNMLLHCFRVVESHKKFQKLNDTLETKMLNVVCFIHYYIIGMS